MGAERHPGGTSASAMLMLVVAAAGTMTMGTKPRTVLNHGHHFDILEISLYVLMSTSWYLMTLITSCSIGQQATWVEEVQHAVKGS